MFDTISYKGGETNHIVTFNSVAGTLVKSTPQSKIIRFHMNSRLADTFFDIKQPFWKEKEYPYTIHKVDVLQVMLCGGDQYMVEYLENDKDDK